MLEASSETHLLMSEDEKLLVFDLQQTLPSPVSLLMI